MQVKEITVSFGGTVNLGNYENFKIDLSITAETETHPNVFDIDERCRELFTIVRGLVREEVARLASRNGRGWLRDTDLKAERAPEESS